MDFVFTEKEKELQKKRNEIYRRIKKSDRLDDNIKKVRNQVYKSMSD